MVDKRIKARDLQVGDVLVSRGSRVVEVAPLPAGFAVQGPRGGKYRTRFAGDFLGVLLASGVRAVVDPNATVLVARNEVQA